MLLARLFKILGNGKWSSRLGEEDFERLKFVNYCRVLTYENLLPCVWFSVPNEFGGQKQHMFGAKLNVLGRVCGSPDLVFLWSSGCLCLEFKSLKGKLSENQEIFKDWCDHNKVNYHVVRSCEEAKRVLKNYL